jgi:hypothetical protein
MNHLRRLIRRRHVEDDDLRRDVARPAARRARATVTLLGMSKVSVVPLGTVFATAQTLAGADRQNPLLTLRPCALPVVTVTVDPATPIVDTATAHSTIEGRR